MKLKSIKFGGTSMGSAKAIMASANIIRNQAAKDKVIVTVSAVAGVTDTLLEIILLAQNQKPRLVNKKVAELEKLHNKILSEIIGDEDQCIYIWLQDFDLLFKRLKAIASGVSLVGDLTNKTKSLICAFGEKLSSQLMKNALTKLKIANCRIESEKIIRTDSNYLKANVHSKTTNIACRSHLFPLINKGIVPIITGFIGKDTHGDTTLLGRGGSDYTASIVAIALKADLIEIWTDVNGIMSGDPRLINNTVCWDELDVELMSEMAYSGAKVVHPATITLAIQKNIPVYVFNTFDLSFKGTKITNKINRKARGVVASSDYIMIILEHPEIIDHIGFLAQASSVVAKYNVSIDVCATSEISFSFTIREEDYSKKLHKDLAEIANVRIIKKVTKICVIGYQISKDQELLSTVFTSATHNQINIHAVSISASYHNITLIIDNRDKSRFVKILHDKCINVLTK